MKNTITVAQAMTKPIPDNRTPDQLDLERIAVGCLRLAEHPDNFQDAPRLRRIAGICIDASFHPDAAGYVLELAAEQLGLTHELGDVR